MKPRVKICGLKDTETIRLMNGLPIHEIGLVFAPSKRQVDKAAGARLVAAIRNIKTAWNVRPNAVGVFVNADLDELSELLIEVPLDIVQLHGNESPSYCEELRRSHPSLQIWRVFSIQTVCSGDFEAHAAEEARERLRPFAGCVDAFLIDAPGGGTGQSFNWTVIQAYKYEAYRLGLPIYVAGGLHPDNVQELLKSYTPDGIDVSSGVETEGRKDIEKIRWFVRKVMEA